MDYHPQLSASQLYLDADGNAALEVGNRLIVVLAGSFQQTRIDFKESKGPVWTHPHATVRLDSQGCLNFQAGANRLRLSPVPAGSRIVGLVQHPAKPMAFTHGLDALAHASRNRANVSWQAATDLPATATLVGLR